MFVCVLTKSFTDIQSTLADMASEGVMPDVNTFNAVLFTLGRSAKYSKALKWSLQTINEMKNCGIGETIRFCANLEIGFLLSLLIHRRQSK